MAEQRFCAKARKEAKGYDKPSTQLLSLLKLPVRAGDTKAIVSRVDRLIGLFLDTTQDEAAKLHAALTDPKNPLGRFYTCELATKTRTQLLSLLHQIANRIEIKPKKKGKFEGARVITVIADTDVSPLEHPRYVDRVAEAISIRVVLAEWLLIWRHKGREIVAGIPRNRMGAPSPQTLLWAVQIFDSEELAKQQARAMKSYNQIQDDGYEPQIITFYYGPGNTIRPTLYTPVTAPRLMDGIKMYIDDGHLLETVEMYSAYYEVIKDFVNPTFLDMDQEGNISITGPPKFPKVPKLNWKGLRRLFRWKQKPTIKQLLNRLNYKVAWRSPKGTHEVYETAANQLIGSFDALQAFRKSKAAAGKYKGWHRHHIVEDRHLKDLGIADLFPGRKDLPCVMLPGKPHSDRIAGALTRALAEKKPLTDLDVFNAYALAYKELGDYTGGGIGAIQKELRRVVGNMLGFD
ncbi:hypothetical protein ACFSUD_16355 [Sulfitobacter aestuarii]|uniref:Uncharacterized protein n=1 Tax=Sulfitobacter aestuarii TaxID=2161676 RepID=A0ABW5U5I5_9RHOB